MLRKTAGMMAVVLTVGCLAGGAAAADKAALDKAFAVLAKYDWGQSREPLNAIDEALLQTHGKAAERKDLEGRLIAVLKGDAPSAAKQYVCRKLAIVGTAASVDALAPLLTDAKLSHMGRYALERMPCPAAGAAIRNAIGKVSGKLKVGMINSVGMRQDAQAVALLTPLLKDSDAQAAAAAAAALGKIGDPAAGGALASFLASAPKPLKNAAIDAMLDFAGRIGAKGEKAAAAKIYQGLYADGQPTRVRRAALRGLAMVQPTETVPLILKALSATDAGFRGLAVNMIAEMPGAEATRKFAAELPKLPAAGKVAMLDALAARKDPAACPAVVAAAKSGDAAVKAAAIQALGAVGGAAQVPMLAQAAAGKDDAAAAARSSLARLRGKDVNAAILSAGQSADAKTKVALINALAARSATDTADKVLAHVKESNADVSAAAVAALAVLGSEKQLPALVAHLKGGGDARAMDKTLSAIATRVKEKAADCLIGGLGGASADAQVVLLTALSRAGGDRALKTIIAKTSDGDAKVQEAAVRALAEWRDKAALAPMTALAEKTDNKVFKILALRGMVRLAAERGTPTAEKWAALSKAMAIAESVNDTGSKKLVLGALRDVQTLDAFKLVAKYVDVKGLTEEAGSAAVNIGNRVWNKDKALAKETIAKVVANVRNRRTKRDADNLLKKIK